VTGLYRLDCLAPQRSNVGVPVASAVTIAPDGRVIDGPTVTEPGPTGEPAVMVWHNAILDEPFAAFLVDRGQGHRLRPLEEGEIGQPRTEAMRVATPQHIRHWYAGEVAAGRIVPPEHLPPVAVRRALRETHGLSRPRVAAQLGVSVDALRLWEEGLREPQGANRAAYLSLLTSWASGPPEPAREPAEPEAGPAPRSDPQRQPGVQPGRGPLTNASHKQALTAAVRAHQARMRTVHGRP
jgi:DNA-binding transcriptional regulator YiaG